MQRRRLMFQIIGDLQDISVLNFGEVGIDRPEPWKELSKKYADNWKYGDATPNLILSEEKHRIRNGGKKHLIDSFVHTFDENGATLTNTAPYADAHQLGYGISRRAYYPVNESGELTPFAEERLKQIVREHFET